MRQGELLALSWRDVDMDRGKIQVRGNLQSTGGAAEPKTSSGRRQITLTSLALEALKRHRIRQNEARLAIGPAWTDLGLIFTNTVGGYLDVNNLRHRAFPRLLERSGVPRIRFHDLRHSTATRCSAWAFIRRSSRSYSGTHKSPSPSTSTATSCLTCSARRWPRWMHCWGSDSEAGCCQSCCQTAFIDKGTGSIESAKPVCYAVEPGRSGRIRTRDLRFWRPLL